MRTSKTELSGVSIRMILIDFEGIWLEPFFFIITSGIRTLCSVDIIRVKNDQELAYSQCISFLSRRQGNLLKGIDNKTVG